MSQTPRTIAIVEDESELRRTLSEILVDDGGWTITGAYPNAELALPALLAAPPEVVLMDIQLPGMSGIECTAALKDANPEIVILVLTVFENADRVFNALAAGASGYLLKRDVPTRLREALDEAVAGACPISSSVARKVVLHFMKPSSSPSNEDFALTPREKECLELLAKGKLYKEIADEMSIGTETVRFHLHNIYGKLQVRTRTEAVVRYFGQ